MIKIIKLWVKLIRVYGFKLLLNPKLIKLCMDFPDSNFSWLSVIKIQDSRVFSIGKGSSVGDFTKICVDDDVKSENISNLIIGNMTYIGDHNNIRASGGDIIIGNYCLISQNITMVASNHSFKKNELIYLQAWDKTKTGITIEDDVWIGANSVILPGVTLHKGCIVAAGSIVNKSVLANTIVGGVPAKLISTRN